MARLTEYKFFKILNITVEDFDLICTYIDDYYRKKVILKKDSEGKPRYDGNGKRLERILYPSHGQLKRIQKQIESKFLKKIELPYYIQGGVKNRSNVTNAKLHKGSKYKFLTDIKSFYPSISNDQVFKTLLELGFSKLVSSHITKLTTYKGMLPQGTPTSTTLSNLVFRSTDLKLMSICKAEGIKYSRFVDDTTFSSNVDFKSKINSLLKIIQDDGYRISHKKTFYKSSICNITGVMTGVNHFGPPFSLQSKLNETNLTEDQLNGLNGYIEYIKRINIHS